LNDLQQRFPKDGGCFAIRRKRNKFASFGKHVLRASQRKEGRADFALRGCKFTGLYWSVWELVVMMFKYKKLKKRSITRQRWKSDRKRAYTNKIPIFGNWMVKGMIRHFIKKGLKSKMENLVVTSMRNVKLRLARYNRGL